MSAGDRFRKELIDYLEKEGYDVSEAFCVKNNGGKDGIVFHDKSAFSPVFYTGQLQEQYFKGRPLREIAQKLINEQKQISADRQVLGYFPLAGDFQDYKKVRKDLRLCMVKKSANEELLAETPHRDYGDFAAIAYWSVGETVAVSMLFKQEVLAVLKIGFDRVFKDAYINMMGEFELKSMEEMLYETVARKLKAEQMQEIPADQYIRRMCQGTELYMMTHKSGRFGSAAMCYQREMERVAERTGGDFVVIPSSVHELLFLPFRKNFQLEAVNELIRQVNERLDQEERLSDAAYVYCEKEKCIMEAHEYLRRMQIAQWNELHQRDGRAAENEWRDDRCLM